MKAYLLAGAAITSALLTAPAHAQNSGAVPANQLYVNGQRTGGEVAPRMLGNTMYVPLRFVTDYLGGGATWDNAKQTAVIKQGVKQMTLMVGETRAVVNGEGRALTAPIRLQEGRILLPVRDVANLLGAQVTYNASSGAVFVTAPEGSREPMMRQGRAARNSTRPDSNPSSSGPTIGSAP